ncbi:Serine/threonine-protein kinase Sgk3, partial [Dipsacomyces acuminosporus]
MDTSANIPPALKHLLAKSSVQQPQPSSITNRKSPEAMFDTISSYYKPHQQQPATIGVSTLQNHRHNHHHHHHHQQADGKLSAAKSTSSLRTGGSLGAWLSKYNLRPGSSRSNLRSATPVTGTATASTGQRTFLRASDSQPTFKSNSALTKNAIAVAQQPPSPSPSAATLASTNTSAAAAAGGGGGSGGGRAFAAYITTVETREANGSSASPSTSTFHESRIGGLRMGRKRFLVYRILVSGRTGQWWVSRRYSEFSDLHSALKRRFPAKASKWGEVPSKRLLPGLSTSTDSVMQRRERLNSFLRSLTSDPEVCHCDAMQQFLRDAPLDVDSIPLSERLESIQYSTQQQNQQQKIQQLQLQTMRSISSGYAIADIGAAIGVSAPYRMPLPEAWTKPSEQEAQKPRTSLERMTSMPSLKSTSGHHQVSTMVHQQPSFDFAVSQLHQQTQPVATPMGYASVGAATGRAANQSTQTSDQRTHARRKTSDPLEYAASAEKRPNGNIPQSMRKKYGLRRNVQYRNDPIDPKARAVSGPNMHFPASAINESSTTLMSSDDLAYAAIVAQDKARSMNWDSDYVMVDRESLPVGDDHALRSSSLESDASSNGKGNSKRRRNLFTLRKTPAGGVEKNRRLAEGDLAVMNAKAQIRNQKRLSAIADDPVAAVTEARDDAGPDIDADGTGRSPNMNGPQKITLDDFHLLSVIGKGSYGK